MPKISDRILSAIKQTGMSYSELSKVTGIAKSALQRYATGETEKVPIDRLEKIANATGVSVQYLMGWEEKPPEINSDSLSQKIIETFNSLDDEKQKTALEYLEFLASRDNSEK